MNCTLTRATSAELNTYGTDANWTPDTSSVHNAYATAPMAAVLPPYQPPSEEELHTSFEQAISHRTSELHERLSRYSYPALSAQRRHSTEMDTTTIQAQNHAAQTGWQRFVIFSGLALIFMLIGFDLMGLLVLHMH
ncbi:hypothetical protein KSF_037900 [Reticulibacter mediterranei]|uniref:Uncharacterized protein n=1 Tax=Reticulibacter mediterranei TaxID=2778369 RepID=A0A8J3N194_9CHLR|nr:hypothetical protein [Reticulibacter mediterranei]GHO93742.1 hypothetical protein KSF_037900 [Reticulibacter mediterranei]